MTEGTDRFTFLFVVRGGGVATYRRMEISGEVKFDLIPSRGFDFQNFNDGFWNWWRDQFNFVSEGSEVDFAFVATDPELKDFNMPDDFKLAPQTTWTRQLVCRFMDEFKRDSFRLIEDGRTLCDSHDADSVAYYLTRFNVPKEPAQKPVRASLLYEEMRDGPLPPEILEEIRGSV